MKDTYYLFQSVMLNTSYFSQPPDVITTTLGRQVNCFSSKWGTPKPRSVNGYKPDHVLNNIINHYF